MEITEPFEIINKEKENQQKKLFSFNSLGFKTPLNTGHLVNDGGLNSNVMYVEFCFPFKFPASFNKKIGNICWELSDYDTGIRTVMLVSTKKINGGTEILSNYSFIAKVKEED